MVRILSALFFIFISFHIAAQTPDYVPNTVIVKIDQQLNTKGEALNILTAEVLQGLPEVLAISTVAKATKGQASRANNKSVLDGIYKIILQGSGQELDFINNLQHYKNIIYAERYPNVSPLVIPNDPAASSTGPQYHLGQVKAYDAWNLSQANEDIIIAIIDTGVDLDHEDLRANLYVNEGEIPNDGIDNDADGFIDNYTGWDFADDDKLPEADNDQHGTLVTGLAAAATNNSVGIAGVGYRAKFLPIKIFDSQNNFSRNSYEGIIYAANQGSHVINLSWGGTSGYSQFAQDVINYAVLEKDAVVIAAAGNTNANLDFYPASYDNVLSVGYVNASDARDPNATFSNFIDLVAPGVNIYTTYNDDAYGTEGGSSLAAPIVAGAAALLRERFPAYSAIEIMEQLRINTDDVYDVGANSAYKYLMGTGRLNILKAVSNSNNTSVRMTDFSYSNGREQSAYYGDTLTISSNFTAYLNEVTDLKITLRTNNPFVTLVDSVFEVGNLAVNKAVDNEGQSFQSNTVSGYTGKRESILPLNFRRCSLSGLSIICDFHEPLISVI